MNKEEIKQKLIDNGLENYISVFEENNLFDQTVLQSLTNEDYISIGITILGDRKKLQLLFAKVEETTENKEIVDETPKEEYINIVRGGKEFCYLSTEPGKMLCRKCHKRVSEDATLCSNCNNNLIEQTSAATSYNSYSSPIVSQSSSEDINSKYIPPKKSNKGKVITFIVVAFVVAFITYSCVTAGSSSGSSYSSSSSSKSLSGVSASLSATQLELTTIQTLHNVRIRINGDYTYEVSILSPGSYTVGLASFADSKGNRFNPRALVVTRVSIFCKEGSTGFTPKN